MTVIELLSWVPFFLGHPVHLCVLTPPLSLSSEEPGLYEAVVPVVINEQWATPYQMLYISGQLQEPKVWFDPPGICMTPVPLLTDIHCEFNVLASQYQA